MADPETLLPFAHAGHWILYLAPLVIVLAVVVIAAVRERRAQEGEGEQPPQS